MVKCILVKCKSTFKFSSVFENNLLTMNLLGLNIKCRWDREEVSKKMFQYFLSNLFLHLK